MLYEVITGLPSGDQTMPDAFMKWRMFALHSPYFPIGKIMRRILRKIAEDDFSNLGDTSTLAEPAGRRPDS